MSEQDHRTWVVVPAETTPTRQTMARWTPLATIVLVGILLLQFSLPGHGGLMTYILIGILGLLLVIGCSIVLEERAASRWTWTRGRLATWVAVPVALLILVVLGSTGAAMLVRFWLSEPAMTATAEAIASSPITTEFSQIRTFGTYPVETLDTWPGGVRFIVSGGAFSSYGFAYSKEGVPPNLGGEDSYEHLRDSWYLWYEGF